MAKFKEWFSPAGSHWYSYQGIWEAFRSFVDPVAEARGGIQDEYSDYPGEDLELRHDDKYLRSEMRECGNRMMMISPPIGVTCSWGEKCENLPTHTESNGDNGFEYWCEEHCIDNFSF